MSSKTSSRPRSGPTSNGKPANAWSRPLQPKATAGPPPGMGSPPPILRERFLHLTLSLVGQRVQLSLQDGTILEGVFHTFTPFSTSSIKYVLKACKTIQEGPTEVEPGATVIMDAAKVSSVVCKSLRLDTTNNRGDDETFRTDTDISSSQNTKGRSLTSAGSAWTAATATPSNSRAAGLQGHIGEWDQFQANEQLFNVRASFDENLYTTELDKSQIDHHKKQQAEKLAKEIEGQTSSNIHIAEERGQVVEGDYDEEDRYSGVLKKNVQPKTKKDVAKTETTKTESTENEKPKKMNYAAAAAKADAKAAALPPGFAKPVAGKAEEVEKNDEKKEEEPTTTETPEAVAAEETAPEKETTEEKATAAPAAASEEEKANGTANKEEKPVEEKEEKKPATKLNPDAKSFSFNPGAKAFTPAFEAPAETAPAIDPNTGLPVGAPPQMPGQPPYMPHPGMGQPGMVPMMNYAAMRYQGGPYPGMEHQMPMQHPHQPLHVQQQPTPDGATPPAGVEEEGQVAPQQQPVPPAAVPYPPGNYYPGMMRPGGFHPPPQAMGPPVAGTYHPMYGGPMAPMPMRGPGGGNYYPPMHYPYGGMMEEHDQGYRGGRGRGRGGPRKNNSRKGGRGGRGYYSGGSSGRQTPQSASGGSGVEEGSNGGGDSKSTSPTTAVTTPEEQPAKPATSEE